ncbi:cobalamin-binding protein [Kribbella sp. NPDC000426]|uniref:cobalamin-binding protein n=1 Tax=Kribbella sp. NPDC000426 TaxID=3154255 RepID=UPI003328EFCB
MRIVSLLPSATEICFALGAGDDVVGVTFECDYPAAARTRRIVSTTALPAGLTPGEIDAVVRRKVAAGEDLYHLDAGALRELEPDVVITQDLCAVCAIDVDDVSEALNYLGCQAEVVTTDPHTLDEVLDSIETIAKAIDRDAALLVDALRARLKRQPGWPAPRPDSSTPTVGAQAPTQPSTPTAATPLVGVGRRGSEVGLRVGVGRRGSEVGHGVRVGLLEWTDPPFAPGHWLPEMVTLAGGTNVLGRAGARSVAVTWEQVAAAEPEVIVSAPCGFDLQGAARLTTELMPRLPADVPVWAVDANGYFARPGPRLVDGIDVLAAVFRHDAPDPAIARRLR